MTESNFTVITIENEPAPQYRAIIEGADIGSRDAGVEYDSLYEAVTAFEPFAEEHPEFSITIVGLHNGYTYKVKPAHH